MNTELLESEDKVIQLFVEGKKDDIMENSLGILEEYDYVYLMKVNSKSFNIKDGHGNTLLHYAVLKNNHYAISLALELGLSIEIKNNYGLSVVDYSRLLGFENIENIVSHYLHLKDTGNLQKVYEKQKDSSIK